MDPRAWADDPGTTVLLLSRQVGLTVVTASGEELGRLRDLTVRLEQPHPTVHRLLVRARRRGCWFVPWADAALSASEVRLRDGLDLEACAVDPDVLPLEPDELLLARDVLDTEVVDLEGHRLSRVSDVVLLRRMDGLLEVVAVDVGFGAVLRRTGLGALAWRTRPVGVDWEDLHLTSSRGHVVQLSTSTAGFRKLAAPDLAELLARLSAEKGADLLRTVGPERASAALHESHPVTGERLMHALSPAEVRPARYRRTHGWRVRRPPRR